MNAKTLILTREFEPHKIVSDERALLMLFQGKISVIEEYTGDEYIMGVLPSNRHNEFRQLLKGLGTRVQPGCDLIIRTPSVACLVNPVGGVKRGIKFSRINVFTRDGFRCMYCGQQKPVGALNYDHLIPRQQGGKTVWENIVTACYKCNSRKRNRTPEEAGMKVLRRPYKPKSLPMTGPRIDHKDIPVNWIQYVASFMNPLDIDTSAVA